MPGRARATLVFVHGPCLGPWAFTETLVPHLAPLDLHCVVPDLHEAWPRPTWSSRIARLPLARYVDRLHAVLGTLPGPHVLVGHSMGARIVERLVLRGWHDGAVLLAPAPPEGIEANVATLARRWPAQAGRALLERRPLRLFGEPGHADPARVAAVLLPRRGPAALAAHIAGALRDESFVACLDWVRPQPPPPRTLRVPVLAIGGRDDVLVPPPALRRAAAAWGATAHVVAHAGHGVMFGEAAATVAAHIGRWLFD